MIKRNGHDGKPWVDHSTIEEVGDILTHVSAAQPLTLNSPKSREGVWGLRLEVQRLEKEKERLVKVLEARNVLPKDS